MRCSKPQMEADPSPRTQADPATFGPAPRPAPVVGLKVQPTGWRPSLVRRTLLCLALLLGVCSGPAFPQAIFIFPAVKLPLAFPPMPSVPLNERLLHIPMTVSRPSGVQRLTLEATLYRPDGPGPFPLVILSHGTARDPRQRVGTRLRYDAQSWEFVSMGFAVVIPVSMLGEEANWVQNVKATGGKALLRHGISEQVLLTEVDIKQRAPILKAYLQLAPGARPHIPVSKDAPVEEFEKIASKYPVFSLETIK